MVTFLSTKLGTCIELSDISVCHLIRNKTSNKPDNVIVRFINRKSKIELLIGAKALTVNSEAADGFSWQPLNELSSDHSPILIKWNQLVKTERAQRRVRPNFQKAD